MTGLGHGLPAAAPAGRIRIESRERRSPGRRGRRPSAGSGRSGDDTWSAQIDPKLQSATSAGPQAMGLTRPTVSLILLSTKEDPAGVRRRDFIVIAAGAVGAWSHAARAQHEAVPVIGFLGSALSGPYAPYVAAFRQGLSETGYVEGKNLAIEYRWAEGRYERLPALAADLVNRKVDLIAASGGNVSALAAKNATATIPIVRSE